MKAASPPAVVFVEDDPELRAATLQSLKLAGFVAEAHERAAPALRSLSRHFAGVVVSDIRLPGMDGLEFHAAVRAIDAELPFIFTTGHGDVAMAVDAMKDGAEDFLTKPYAAGALIDAIRRASGKRALVLENRRLREALRERRSVALLGRSERARRLEALIGEVARTEIDVLLTGSAGVGKTYLARRIHELSGRDGRPFVTIDAGIWTHPDAELIIFGRDPSERLSRSGLIERAQGGSLILDNIEAVPSALQGRIASLLETRSYRAQGAERQHTSNARIIAVIGESPGAAAQTLSRRLSGITIAIPALVERPDDIPDIFRHFVASFEAETNTVARPFKTHEWNRLLASQWPGNLRELRDFACNFVLGLTDFEEAFGQPQSADQSLSALVAAFERSILIDALRKFDGRAVHVERALGMKRKTLYDKLARYGLKPRDFRGQ